MKEMDKILDFLRSTDGVNQLQRSIPAQDPESARIDERSKTDLIHFLKRLSQQITYYNLNNIEQGNWSAFFDNLNPITSIYARAATTASLSGVYDNGVNGVDASFKGLSNGLLIAQDGVELTSGDILLVWKQDAPIHNGVYVLSQGTPSKPFILTRLISSSHKRDFTAQLVEVTEGSLHGQHLFTQQTLSPIIGTNDIVYHKEALSKDNWPPDQALFLAFLHLYGLLQQDINQLTAKHLVYYYEEVLKIQRKNAAPDKVHTVFELNKNAAPVLLPAGTLLDGGKTPDGKFKRNYILDSEILINHASVMSLKSSFTDETVTGKKVVFKADDATQVKLETRSGFRPFGMGQLRLSPESKNMTEAKLGFAVASPNFSLSEGERKIVVTLNLQASVSSPPSNAYQISVTSAEGWMYPLFIVKEASSSKLTFEATIPLSEPAVVSYDEQVHGPGFVTSYPLFRCELLPYAYQLESLSNFTIGSVDIQVEALGITGLILQNDEGLLDPANPILPFGNQPLVQSNFYIGSTEIFSKSLSSLSVHLEWQDPPEDFRDYYSAYGSDDIGGFGNNIFTSDLYLLAGKKWNTRLLFNQSLFNPLGTTLPQVLRVPPSVMPSALFNSGYNRDPSSDDVTAYSPGLSTGFVKLVLTGPTKSDMQYLPSYAPFEAFGHKSYSKVYTRQAIALGQFTPPGSPPELPSDPYTPALKSVNLDYTAGDSFYPSKPNGIEQFFSLDIFGSQELVEYGTARIVPKVPKNGALYIGIKDASPPQLLSMLFPVIDGSAPGDTLLHSTDLIWSYLSKDQWKLMTAGAVLEDSTNGLQRSGLIRLNLGADATETNTFFNEQLYWLRVMVDENADGAGNLEAIQLQAMSSTLVSGNIDETSFVEHLARPLPPKTIGKLVKKVPGIKNVIQDYASVRGIAPETNSNYFQRVSERIRHKNRAVFGWDYERLVLDKFPQVFKVKCLSHSDPDNQIVPGNVKLVIVPDFRKLVGGDPLQPRCNAALLRDIGELLTQNFTSPFVKPVASNPKYETLLVDCKVSFLQGFDPGYYSTKLDEEIKQFLSAWAYDEGEDITFGGKIYRNELLAFVEGRYYVDYVVDFKVYHRFKGRPPGGISKMTINEDFTINLTPTPTIGVSGAKIGNSFIVGQPVEVAKATQTDSILVSNNAHRIRAIQNEDFLCSGHKNMGIGQMIVKVNFIVQ
jgi:hypothetical protein